MADQNRRASKADVQSTELNKMPAENEMDTEISAELAAEAFKPEQANRSSAQNEQ